MMTRFLKSRRGASLIGYGLLVGLIAVVAIAAITRVGSSVTGLFDDVDLAIQGVPTIEGELEYFGTPGQFVLDFDPNGEGIPDMDVSFPDPDEPLIQPFVGNRYELRIRRSNRIR